MDLTLEIQQEKLKEIFKFIETEPCFSFLKKLKKTFPQGSIFLVGGVIRDQLLGRKSKDFDFVVTKIKAQDLKIFLEKEGRVDLVGTTFGVFKFVPKESQLNEAFDIALPRTEISTGPGYREFEVRHDSNLSIEEDLSRRDFTINAQAVDIKTQKLIDPFHGLEDLEKRQIKTVGDPKTRFSEDYSRILRALRFACQLDFCIEKKTWEAIKNYAPKILEKRLFEKEEKLRERTIVPWETVGHEFLKTIEANPKKMLDLYDQAGILKLVLPEVEAEKGVPQPPEFHQEGDVYVHTRLVLENLKKDAPIELKLATLLHDIGKPPTLKIPEKDQVERIRFDEHAEVGAQMAEKIAQRLRLSKNLQEKVTWLIKNHLLFVTADIEEMRKSTIKKYFIDDKVQGDNLLELYRAENLASVSPHQKEDLKKYKKTVKYIEEVRKSFAEAKVVDFRHIINGNEIMKEFNIPSGPKVGELLSQAYDFITEYIAKNKKEPQKEKVLGCLKNK